MVLSAGSMPDGATAADDEVALPLAADGTQVTSRRWDAGAKAVGRLHYLDWLRALMIAMAVYLHILQTLSHVPVVVVDNAAFAASAPGSTQALTLGQERLGHVHHSYRWKWIMQGRQICIPLLFFVSGSALAHHQRLWASLEKLVKITVVGMSLNALVYFAGPRNEECSFVDAPSMPECQRGFLLNFTIAPHSGSLFPILYQFWFTVFLMLFLVEDAGLFTALRSLEGAATDPGSGSGVWPPQQALTQMALSWVGTAGLYVLMSLLGSPAVFSFEFVGFVVLEGVFSVLLLLCAGTPSSAPSLVRCWQYLAAFCAVLQFSMPTFNAFAFNGGTVLYFHLFKKCLALGFLAHAVRTKAAPVASRAWPLVLLLVIMFSTSTNWYMSGMPTYPWLPRFCDRFVYIGGTFICLFIVDRIGGALTQQGGCAPLPGAVGQGLLAAYILHGLGIVLLVQLPGFRGAAPEVVALAIIALSVAGVAARMACSGSGAGAMPAI